MPRVARVITGVPPVKKGHPMNDPSVRKQKSCDQLSVGDWLAPGELLEGAAEVLFAHAYPSSADRSRDNDGTHVQLVVREQSAVVPFTDVIGGNTLFNLASDEDLAELREAAMRAQKIADIRSLASFLEANPDVPMSPYMLDQTDLKGPEGLATVRALAVRLGVEVNDSLDDRTSLEIVTGHHRHKLIAWHPEGRPAEPAAEHHHSGGWKGEGPGTCGAECVCGVTFDGFDTLAEAVELVERHVADPLGLDRSRADDEPDDPTPVSPARVPLHTGGMTDGGLVDETDRCVASLHIPTPGATCGWCGAQGMRSAQHVEASAASDGDTYEAECTCGVTVEGFDSFADARAELERHIADATGVPCYAPNGYQAPEVIAERTAACAASHPDRPCTTPSAAELGERAGAAIRKTYGEPCQGAPAGFEADCGTVGPHGPHGLLPASES
jgi:hypothetical protein